MKKIATTKKRKKKKKEFDHRDLIADLMEGV